MNKRAIIAGIAVVVGGLLVSPLTASADLMVPIADQDGDGDVDVWADDHDNDGWGEYFYFDANDTNVYDVGDYYFSDLNEDNVFDGYENGVPLPPSGYPGIITQPINYDPGLGAPGGFPSTDVYCPGDLDCDNYLDEDDVYDYSRSRTTKVQARPG